MSCTVEPTSFDKTLADYDQLFSDKMVLLIIYLVIAVIFILGIFYIISHLISVVKDYYKERGYNDVGKANKNSKVDPNRDSENPRDKEADNEFYPVDDESAPPTTFTISARTKPSDHKDPNERRFYDQLETKYSDYNTQKTKYIQQHYDGKDNDDIVNENIAYAKYDDYKYTKVEKNQEKEPTAPAAAAPSNCRNVVLTENSVLAEDSL
jgi:hypothetical protein